MDISLLCKQFALSDITNVDTENSFFKEMYKLQKELLQKILKAEYLLEQLKRTNSENPILDSAFFYYDKEVTISSNTLTIIIENQISGPNQFVDEEYVDAVVSTKYQTIDNVSSFIYQQVITGDTDTTRDIILTSDYFLSTYFNANKKTIVNSTLKKIGLDNKDENELVGLLEIKEKFISINETLSLSNSIIKSPLVTITNKTIDGKVIDIEQTNIIGIYCSNSDYLINNMQFSLDYITYNNLYLKDLSVISDDLSLNTNLVKVIDLMTELENTKASKNWQVPYLIKLDSGKTDVESKIVDAVIHNNEIDTDEMISYSEFVNSINKVLTEAYKAIGEC